jgi:hypothetical protein
VVLVLAVAAAGASVYVTRRVIAREVLIGWLESRGIPAEVQFREFEFGGFSARVRAGTERDPDVTADLVEIRYGLTGFWAGRPLGVEVASVTLHRPIVRASLKGGEFSLGSLDPLIEEFAKRPAQPGGPKPKIVVREGVIRLATDYGPLTARADGRMEGGKLMALDARFDPAKLKGEGLAASTGPARLLLITNRDRVDILLTAPVTDFATGAIAARNGALRFSAQGPYPDFEKKRGEGKVVARLDLNGAALDAGDRRLKDFKLLAQFDGSSTGWFETLALRGDGSIEASAGALAIPGVEARTLRAEAGVSDLRWTRSAGDVVSSEITALITAGSARAGDLSLSNARADFGGLVAFDDRRLDLALKGSVASRGAWSGLGPVRPGDEPATAALKKAVSGFQLTANSLTLNVSHDDLSVRLGVPARLRTDSGGEASLYRVGGPVYANGAGAFDLKVSGGGLPQASVNARSYRLTPDGLVATGGIKVAGSYAPVQDGVIEEAGDLRLANGAIDFTASGCAPITAAHVELGENDLEQLAGQLCPVRGAPLLSLKDGAWRLRGEVVKAAAAVPFLEAKVSELGAKVDLRGEGSAMRGQIAIAGARIDDLAAETRFRPVRGLGQVRAAGGGWTGDLVLTDLDGRHLADADLRHGADGRGELAFDTGMLTFEDGGLQPVNLSPMASLVASPATGRARFDGRIAWGPDTSDSAGTLSVERMDFVSPLGPVVGLTGQVLFTSLIPLTAAPGQSLKAEALNTLVPLTDVDIRFGLENETLVVEGAQLAVGGGTLAFEPFTLPFKAGEPWKGVLNFQGVQIKELVEASPFGDRVDLEARLTGRVPFEVRPEGVRVAGGTLAAIEPGRLSILREALTTVGAEGGAVTTAGPVPAEVAPEATNAFTEFAYQAMEHLSFDQLDAEVNSLDNGRLGVLLHVKGEHTPPQKQEIRLTIMELIRRDFMNKTLPLPSGTKVDLTLDTSLNMDQLLKDFADYQALRGSQAVQP